MKSAYTRLVREYGEVYLQGAPTIRKVRVSDGVHIHTWCYLEQKEDGLYKAGGYVGAVNATDESDLVIVPKVPGVDFVGMMCKAAQGGVLTGERLDSIVYSFPDGRPVPLLGSRVFLREYLALLVGILVVWTRRVGTDGIGPVLAETGEFLDSPFGKEVARRLEENGLNDSVLHGGCAGGVLQVNDLDAGLCCGRGVRGAAARVLGAVRSLGGGVPGDDGVTVEVMPFLVDMPLLFELYCLCLLRDGGSPEDYLFQREFHVGGSRRFPDILDCRRKILMDCKYKPWMRDGVDAGDVSQMGGYSLISELRDLLGYGRGNFCMYILFLYPDREGLVTLDGHLWSRAGRIDGLYRVRRLGVRLPVLEDDYAGERIIA